MSRFRKVPFLTVLTVLIATQAGWVHAGFNASGGQFCGWGFGASPGPGALDVSLQMDTGPLIKTKTTGFTLPLPTAPATGPTVAAKAANALCSAAVASGFACRTIAAPTGTCSTDVGPAATCAEAAAGVASYIVCSSGAPATDRFTIKRDVAHDDRFNVTACFATNPIKKHEVVRTDGGMLKADLLASVLLRYEPDGVPGNVDFNAVGAPGPGPNPFTVNSVGKSDLEFHQAVCNGFSAIGVPASLRTSADNGRFLDSPPSSGYFVELFHPASVTDIIATPATTGPNLTMQMDGAPTGIPTLSEWGMAILIAILLITGAWMLRRRQRLSPV